MPPPRMIGKDEMQACFDGAAATYDTMAARPFARWGARLVAHLALAPGEHVLDVATGIGAVLLPAGRAVGPGGRVTGVDLSAEMVQAAGAAAQAAGLPHVTVRQADAEHLPFADATFDVVTCALSLFMFHDLGAALHEMRRVCRPGGRLGLTLFARSPAPFEPGWTLFGQQAVAWGVATRTPQRVAYAPDDVAALLVAHGLSRVTLAVEADDVVFPTEAEWWAFQLTLGTRVTLLGMDEATRARFKAEHLQRLSSAWQPDGLHTAAGLIYAIAYHDTPPYGASS